MNETLITLQGYVGGDVRIRAAGESQVATFRVGCTPRRFSKKEDAWVDGDTQWYAVNCWRAPRRARRALACGAVTRSSSTAG